MANKNDMVFVLAIVVLMAITSEVEACKERPMDWVQDKLLFGKGSKPDYPSAIIDMTFHDMSLWTYWMYRMPRPDLFVEKYGCSAFASSYINSGSTCSWQYTLERLDSDKYYPNAVLRAVSRCGECKSDTNMRTRCMPVRENVVVMFKTGNCVNGYDEWKRTIMSIPRSYTCAIEGSKAFSD